MLHGEYVEDLGLHRLGGVQDTRQLRRELANAPILDLLREQGYAISTITPAMTHVTLPGANATVSSGNMTDLEVSLLTSSGLGRLLIAAAPDLVLDQQRATVLYGFDVLPRTATSGGPHLLLAHLMVPHVPFLFDRNGVPLPLPDCFPDRCFLWEGSPNAVDEDQPDYLLRYAEQVEWVNDRTLRALSELIQEDPDAIVVVMGDHGSRLLGDDPGEQFRNLFAARTPGHAGLFGPSPTLINVLPSLLDAYLGLQLPVLPDRHYLVRDLQQLLETEPWP
jgi:hypothetical protein